MPRSTIDFKGLSLDRLESLSRVVRHGTITRAADGDTNVQTQFSRQIGELEEYFALTLLDRSGSPRRPTPAAEELAGLTETFLADLERLRQHAAGERQTVVIGAGDAAIRTLLIPLAKRLVGRKIRLILRNLTSRGIQAELKGRRLDIGILHPDRVPDGFERENLPAMEMALIVPTGPLRARTMKWADLDGRPLVLLEGGGRFSKFVREQAKAAGVRLDVAIECSSSVQAIDAVRHCGCYGFVRRQLKSLLPPEVAMVNLGGLAEFKEDYSVAWRQSGREDNPAMDKVLKVLFPAWGKTPA